MVRHLSWKKKKNQNAKSHTERRSCGKSRKKPIECLNAITCPLAINDCKRKEVIVAVTDSNFFSWKKKKKKKSCNNLNSFSKRISFGNDFCSIFSTVLFWSLCWAVCFWQCYQLWKYRKIYDNQRGKENDTKSIELATLSFVSTYNNECCTDFIK